MTLYATGSMLGAGIYGLVGRVTGDLACLFAIAGSSRANRSILCLARLRYPRAGGAAYVA